jgi:hypothetical protein
MKKLLAISLFLVLGTMSCQSPIIQVEAQTLPYNMKAGWDNNPATDNVTSYSILIDGQKAVTVDPSVCTPTRCNTVVPVGTAGQHTISIFATNQFGDGAVVGCASCAFTINIAVPTAVQNFKFTP